MTTPPPAEPAEPQADPAEPQADPHAPPPAAQRSLPMPRLFVIMAAVIGGVLLYSSLGNGLPGAPMTPRVTSSSAPTAPASGVPWQDYDSSTKSRIDNMVKLQDCADLKRMVDAAQAGNEATIAQTGHDNSALIAYIDAAMQEAGCGGG
jgi:hypothetical protein